MGINASTKDDQDTIYVVGNNMQGQLCMDHKRSLNELTMWRNKNTEIKSINLGCNYTILTTSNNQYLCDGSFSWNSCGLKLHIDKNNHIDLKAKISKRNTYFAENNINIKQIYTSPNALHTIWTSANGQLYGSGKNRQNEYGVPINVDTTRSPNPILIRNTPENIIDIALGRNHTLILTKRINIADISRIISFWIKHKSTSKVFIPNDIITIIHDYTQFKGNVYSTVYFRYSSTIGQGRRTYGANGDGANNFGDKQGSFVEMQGFHQIPFFKNKIIKRIGAGGMHSLFLDDENILWCCGMNDQAQLGLGHAEKVGREALMPQKNLWFMENKIIIKEFSCGWEYNLILDVNGNCYGFGSNEHGQCGVGEKAARILSPRRVGESNGCLGKIQGVKCGCFHGCIWNENGKYFLFGKNHFNQCTLVMKDAVGCVYAPFCINDIFDTFTDGERIISDIYLGLDTTWIKARKKSVEPHQSRGCTNFCDCDKCNQLQFELLELMSS